MSTSTEFDHYSPVIFEGGIAPTQFDRFNDLTLYANLVAGVFGGSYVQASNLVQDADVIGGAFERHKIAAGRMMDRWETGNADTKFQDLDMTKAIYTAFDVSSLYFNESAEAAALDLLEVLQTIKGSEQRLVTSYLLEIMGVRPVGNDIHAIRRDERRAFGIARVSELMFPGRLGDTAFDMGILDPIALAQLVGHGKNRSKLQQVSHHIFTSIIKQWD